MRRLLLPLVIGCFAFAGGAPNAEEGKIYTKNFEFDNKEVIYAARLLFKDELAYAVCESGDAVKKCKVYVESTNLDQNTVQSCDVNVTSDRPDYVVLFNAGNSKTIFTVQDGSTTVRLINVNLKDCQMKVTSVDVTQRQTEDPEAPHEVMLVPHEHNYDVLFHNKQICNDFLCKATYDYEGKLVNAASSFPVKVLDSSHYYVIGSIDHGYHVSVINVNSTNIYLIHDTDEKPHTLYSGAQLDAFGFSTEENKLRFCRHADRKLVCQRYDSDGKTKETEFESTISNDYIDYIDVYNVEKGLLVMTIKRESDSQSIFVAHVDEQGNQVKSATVNPKCENYNILVPELYKNSNGQYCVSAVCLLPHGSTDKSFVFSRNTKCFLKTELF